MTFTLLAFLWALPVLHKTAAVAQDSAVEKNEGPDFAALRELANPGPEHDELQKYSGKWRLQVTTGNSDRAPASSGSANSYMTLERRFLWIGYNTNGKAGRLKGSFTIGFDRRNARYSLIAMDTNGTYFVTSYGQKDKQSGRIRLAGKDDDPHMKSMGLDKEFLHIIDLSKPDDFTIEVYYIDTRTPERREIRAMEFYFTRAK